MTQGRSSAGWWCNSPWKGHTYRGLHIMKHCQWRCEDGGVQHTFGKHPDESWKITHVLTEGSDWLLTEPGWLEAFDLTSSQSLSQKAEYKFK